ncbi:hypothetical protein F5050DRAFT_1728332 [Lentinula boryana]|uniref:Uncharacterized protein n=1 Tax=Lentinula boryana TaxID=40481 RepID=A0ABQ8QQT5_9AGAR|nr:hypothetical protein F5050DRAFT_1728332 [Lentinula boryana]
MFWTLLIQDPPLLYLDQANLSLISMYYYSLFDRCEYPFFQPPHLSSTGTMAALGVAASICIAVAVDRLLWNRNHRPPQAAVTAVTTMTLSDTSLDWVLSHCEHVERKLAEKEGHLRELKLVAAASQAKYLQLERQWLANERTYERRCAELESKNVQLQENARVHDTNGMDVVAFQRKADRADQVHPLFVSFLDRLLLANKVWQQQKELQRAKEELAEQKAEKKKTMRANAFAMFRDRLIAANVVWRQQREMKKLREDMNNVKEDAESVKRGRVRAVARSAKQMVVDTRREGMVEELVNGLVEDLRRERTLNEKKVEDMNKTWQEERQKLVSEIEALRLSQQARLIEQEVSNDLEDRLAASHTLR